MAVSAGQAVTGLREPLPRDFYARPSLELARALLGRLVVADDAGGLCAGVIVETEAYGGPDDLASHARAGLTRRTAPMFGPPGHAYVYLVYGMHECLNVVAESDGHAGAVLIRAVAPLHGVGLMRRRRARPTDPDHLLASGPARLAQALGVTRALDGHDLTLGRRLWIADRSGSPAFEAAETAELAEEAEVTGVASGPRVGVGYAGDEWSAVPWRFWLAGNPAVSRPSAGGRAR
ncbi:DNA-3-methyladenine glycosylase [soil metagenome]